MLKYWRNLVPFLELHDGMSYILEKTVCCDRLQLKDGVPRACSFRVVKRYIPVVLLI